MNTDAQVTFRGKTAAEMTIQDMQIALEYSNRTIKKLRAEVLDLRLDSVQHTSLPHR